jgi:4a-hydroxytetrahydrobiopterin dehydratase
MTNSQNNALQEVLTPTEIDTELLALTEGWTSPEHRHLFKEFKFSNFKKALAFTNQLGELAETRRHHPDIFLAWGKVTVTIWTHDAGGITHRDFELAHAIDKL